MKTIIDFTNKVKSLVDGRMSNIANVEENPSTHAYAVGKQLIFNGLLCNATSAIAVGDTLAVGTNLALSDNVVEQIYSLNQGLTNSLADMNNVLGAKNLLPNNAASQTINGVTFTVNSDGSVTVNGTASAYTQFDLNSGIEYKEGKYTLNGCPSEGGLSTYVIWVRNLAITVGIIDNGTGATLNVTNTDTFNASIVVYSGATVNNLTFYPMLRPASIQDDTYVPYSMTNREMTPYVQAISNPNLLDNPWFTVNQRGKTSYYFADRWLRFASGLTFTNNDGVTISGTLSSLENLGTQKIEWDRLKDNIGKAITLSVLIDGTVYKAVGKIETPTSSWRSHVNLQIPSLNIAFQLLTNGTSPSIAECVLKNINTGTINATIKAIKLELGSVSTLAMDTAPNYQQELAKCQRYFQRIRSLDNVGFTVLATGVMESSTRFWGVVPLPVEMRSKPTISSYIGNNNVRICKGGIAAVDGVPVTSIDLDVISTHQVKIDFYCASQSSIPVGTYCTVWSSGNSNVCIDLSSDL